MKQTQRHDAIIELVKKQGYVSTEELVEQFAVSPQTIRRFSRSENDSAPPRRRCATFQFGEYFLARQEVDPDPGKRAHRP